MSGHPRLYRRKATYYHRAAVPIDIRDTYPKTEETFSLKTKDYLGRGTFVPFVFRPGEAFQFDWSEDWATVAGERVKLQVAHIKLSHSRAFLVRAYPLQTHEMLFDALWYAFRVFGGVPGRGIYDNMKTAVDRVGHRPTIRNGQSAGTTVGNGNGIIRCGNTVYSMWDVGVVNDQISGRQCRIRFRKAKAGCQGQQ